VIAVHSHSPSVELVPGPGASSNAWHVYEPQAGRQALPGMAAALRLARVRALTLLGRLDDAAAVLQRLQGAGCLCLSHFIVGLQSTLNRAS
jgi:hypothetical protein